MPQQDISRLLSAPLGLLLWSLFVLVLASSPASGLGNSPALSMKSGELLGLDGKCIEVLGNSSEDRTPLVLATCNGQENQQWTVFHDGSITGLAGKCISSVSPEGQPPRIVLNTCEDGYIPWIWDGAFPSFFELGTFGGCMGTQNGASSNGTPLLFLPCTGEDSQRFTFTSAPTELLILPNIRLSTLTPGGRTTLLALRNAGDSRMALRILYTRTSATGRRVLAENLVLEPRSVYATNLRDAEVFGNLPDQHSGHLQIGAYAPETLEPWPAPPLYGDFFRINPEQNYASGANLTWTNTANRGGGPILCNRWDTRFLHGGGFGGRTVFSFHAATPATYLAAAGKVYDHSGLFLGQVYIAGNEANTVNSADLDLFGATSGTIEWTLGEGALGQVSSDYFAAGRYSVGLQGHCRDE